MKQILITGGNGQLGSELRALQDAYPAFSFKFTDVEDLDITSPAALAEEMDSFVPDYVINCAAYTAVDRAEGDIDIATLINATAPRYLAEAAQQRGATLIHVSTDYVFDGTAHRPYTEEVPTSPDSAYGSTKLEGERHVLKNCKHCIVIRTSWLYSAYGNNFVKTMKRLGMEREELGVIYDQVGTPTYAGDLAKAILDMLLALESGRIEQPYGIYHYSNEGVCSWYDFAVEIFRRESINCKVKPIETKDYPTDAKRPHYSVLNKGKIKSTFGLEIPHWAESLQVCLDALRGAR